MIAHPYTNYAHNEVFWLPTDTKERYDQNLATKRYLLEKFGWVGKEIKYKFNSLGFRSEEFDQEDQAVFLGCSFTVGVGLPVEDTWAYHISKNLNLKCYNLGIGGGSMDLAFRLSYFLLKEIKPKIVFLLCPSEFRCEIFEQNDLKTFLPGEQDRLLAGHGYYKSFISNKINDNMNRQKNLMAIRCLCDDLRIKFISLDQSYHIPDTHRDYARDLWHGGPLANKSLAELFLNKL